MASVTPQQRPSIVLTVVAFGVLALVGLLAVRWVAGLVFALIQMALVLVALYLIARVGLYLLRKGGTSP
ncbi:MAG: hypothetical protein AAFO29_20160 [Actinomycetota bacterium]